MIDNCRLGRDIKTFLMCFAYLVRYKYDLRSTKHKFDGGIFNISYSLAIIKNWGIFFTFAWYNYWKRFHWNIILSNIALCCSNLLTKSMCRTNYPLWAWNFISLRLKIKRLNGTHVIIKPLRRKCVYWLNNASKK